MSRPYLTIAQIETKYPDEWVLIANPTLARYNQVRGGYVVLHSASRDEFDRLFEEWPGESAIKHLASWYTGASGGAWEVLPPDAKPAPETASR